MSRYELCKFFPAPDPELICGICMNVLDTPHETTCRHVFCYECIKAALRENSKCPVCRSPCTEDQSKEVLPLVQNLINKLTMRCDNSDRGCTQLILMEFFFDHIKSCDYGLVQCRYKKCGQDFLRKDCEDHEKNICIYRDLVCEAGCGLVIPFEEMESHNCVESLVTLVKDLKDKNLELQKKIDELEKAVSKPPEPDYHCSFGIESWSNISSTPDSNDSFLTQYRSSYNGSDFDLSELDYMNYRSSPRRSRRIAALLFNETESIGDEISSDSDQSNKSGAVRRYVHTGDNDNADRSLNDVRISDDDNLDGIFETEVVEEVVSSSDGSHMVSGNDCVDSNEILAADMLAADDSVLINSSFVLGFSGNIVSPRKNNENHIGKRPYENNSGDVDVIKSKRIKRSNSNLINQSSTEVIAVLSNSSPESNISNTEAIACAKKHPHGHKKTRSDTRFCDNSSKSGKSDTSLSESCEAGSTSCQIGNSKTTLETQTSGSDLLNNANGLIPNTEIITECNQSASRCCPTTRARRRNNEDTVLEDDVIPNVKVPPSVAYLLNKYAQEDDSSDDESWSPSFEK